MHNKTLLNQLRNYQTLLHLCLSAVCALQFSCSQFLALVQYELFMQDWRGFKGLLWGGHQLQCPMTCRGKVISFCLWHFHKTLLPTLNSDRFCLIHRPFLSLQKPQATENHEFYHSSLSMLAIPPWKFILSGLNPSSCGYPSCFQQVRVLSFHIT